MRRVLCAVAGLVLVACSSVTPVAVKTGDVCFRCGRTITEPKLATQLVAANGEHATFKTPGCLATYLRTNQTGDRTIFVTDYPTGELFPVTTAVFVRGTIDEATGERDYYAFRSAADAAKRAEQEKTTAVDWATVRTLVAAEKPKKKTT